LEMAFSSSQDLCPCSGAFTGKISKLWTIETLKFGQES
jgi:hypothetical protein